MIHRGTRWERTSWRQFALMAACAAARADAELGADAVLLALDNSAEGLAAFTGLAAAGTAIAVFEAGSPLLRDAMSALHAVGARTVVGSVDAPGTYRSLPAAELTRQAGDGALGFLAGLAPADPAVWQSTSGSTGEPRLARQTAANLVRGGVIYADRYLITDRDKLLVTVPMAHSFGLVGGLMCALVTGATLVALTRYSPGAAREAIEGGATAMLGTPLVYELMARSAGPAASSLRMALSSGGPLENEIAEAVRRRLGCPVYQVYGSTETGIIASQFPRDEPWPASSAGLAAPGVRLRLAGPVPAGPDGADLLVRTATMADGYLGGAGQLVDADGWYLTGDLATIDAAGCLTLVRRKDSFVNVGGRKVNPSRVERIIGGHEAVAEVAVYGVETVGGDEVCAAVALRAPCTAEQILAYCRSRLAPYEVPYRLHVVDQLPRSGMGKVDRGRLPR
jgi:acyl-CoA synthetase (AMP-forming)/AMP-acid ligase II